MPIATPFKALGAGNGFPFSMFNVDVSSAHDYMTLGGTRKGTPPTVAEKKLSLANAMKIFWNLYKIEVVGSATTFIEADDGRFNGLAGNWSVTADDLGNGTQPKERISTRSQDSRFGGDNYNYDLGRAEYNNSSFGEVKTSGGTNVFIAAMYNGATTNPDNFIGYGLKDFVKMRGYYHTFSNGYLSGPNYENIDHFQRANGSVSYTSYDFGYPEDPNGIIYNLGSQPQNAAVINVQAESSPFPILRVSKARHSVTALPKYTDAYLQNSNSPNSWTWAWGGDHFTYYAYAPWNPSTNAGFASVFGSTESYTTPGFTLNLSSLDVSYFTYDS
jgi:hypothetical protein